MRRYYSKFISPLNSAFKIRPRHFARAARKLGGKGKELAVGVPVPRWKPRITHAFLLLALLSIGAVIIVLSPKTTGVYLPFNNNPPEVLPTCTASELQENGSKLVASIDRKWYLDGKEILNKGPVSLKLELLPAPKFCTLRGMFISYKVDNTEIQKEITTTDLSKYLIEIGITPLGPGDYTILAELLNYSRDKVLAASPINFIVSKPVYVAWTIDWEGKGSISNQSFEELTKLSNREQKVPITHYFNPRYFTYPVVSSNRVNYYKNWIAERQRDYGDTVGLHMHLYYDLVEAAGVTVRTEPTWANRGTGSDVPFPAYTFDEQKKIIKFGKDTLERQGYKITNFRAGGWYANLNTVRALDELGFTIDSSGRTAFSLGNGLWGDWKLGETAQPYFVCKNNLNEACSGNSAHKVMEVPNTGGEPGRFTAEQMIQRFNANFNGKLQTQHRAITYLSHPEGIYFDTPKLQKLFGHIDQYLYAADRGPVIYTTIDHIYQTWAIN